MKPVTLFAAALLLTPCAALAMPHGKPGLWTVTTSVTMANMPQMSPQMMEMMKSRGIRIPGMGGEPVVSQICMTPQDVADGAQAQQSLRDQHDVNCTPRVLNETASSVTAEITCHGAMEGVGQSRMSWRGDSHYEGEYSFKGSMHGHPGDTSSHFTGDFVKADCGSVKPVRATALH